MIRASGNIDFRHFLYCNSVLPYGKIIDLYLVMSIIVDSLPANTKISEIDPFVDGQCAIYVFLGSVKKGEKGGRRNSPSRSFSLPFLNHTLPPL